jgi:hypothetical protein
MRTAIWKNIGRVCALIGAALASNAHAVVRSGSNMATPSLFPAVACSVSASMEASRPYFESEFSFIRVQGILPWPGVDDYRFTINGIWSNNARGTYAVMKQIEHSDSPKYGALVVQFYSACSHELLAEGTRILSRRDWDTSEVSVSLKNYALKGSRLRAYIRVMPLSEDVSQTPLEIEIREARFGTRDHFYLGRFE